MCESLRTALGFNNNNNMLKYRIPQRTLSFGVGEVISIIDSFHSTELFTPVGVALLCVGVPGRANKSWSTAVRSGVCRRKSSKSP